MIPIPIPLPSVDTEKEPEHIGVGALQGLNKWGQSNYEGVCSLISKPGEGYKEEGAWGAVKGVGQGTLDLAGGVLGGGLDFVSCTLEGVRNTPDAVADVVQGEERCKTKHGVEDEEGKILESYVNKNDKEKSEPQHIGEGLMTGVTAFGMGVFGGAKDLVMKPVESVQQEENVAWGVVKGVGGGLASFTTKTLSGTLDLAQGVVKGVKNTPKAVSEAASYSYERSQRATDSNHTGHRYQRTQNSTGLFEGRGQVLGEGPAMGNYDEVDLGNGIRPSM